MKKEVNSVLGIIVIIVISALICFLTLVIIDNNKVINDNKSNNNETNNNKNNVADNATNEDKNGVENNEVKYEKIENIDAIAKEFYDNFISYNYLLLFNYNNVFKNGNKFNVSDLTFNEKMLITYSYVYWKNYNMNTTNFEISADVFKKYYVKLFGAEEYKNADFSGGFCYCQEGLNIVYDASSNKFIKKAAIEGCGSGPYGEKYLYDKVEQVENKINLYIKFGYIMPYTDGGIVDANKIVLHSDHERKNVVAINIDKDTIESYKDKLNTLIYTLVKDTNTNNYVLESIEVVK